ncbi:hypothetical protein ACF1B0_35600 [Streptomyces anandii]|uniref:hypothetical protein n=1 Tax=Streptomyces anandii TaxID=285454 RepID=UPI003701842F
MNRKLRTTAATVAAAVALGIAAPAAQAATHQAPARTAAVQTTSGLTTAEARALTAAIAQQTTTHTTGSMAADVTVDPAIAAKGGRLGTLINAIKKLGPGAWKATVKAAKAAYKKGKGAVSAFRKWVNGLSWWNPLKWLLKSTPDYVLWQLIDYIYHHF